MKIIRKNYTLSGIAVNGIFTINQSVEAGFEQLKIKQIVLGNVTPLPQGAYKIHSPFLNASVGSASPLGPSKPDLEFDIKGMNLQTSWEFQLRNADNTMYDVNNEELCIDIEFSKLVKE